MPTKRKEALYYTWSADEKEIIALYLTDCWTQLERERIATEASLSVPLDHGVMAKLVYINQVEAYLKQRFNNIGASLPGELEDADTDQPSSDRLAGKGRD